MNNIIRCIIGLIAVVIMIGLVLFILSPTVSLPEKCYKCANVCLKDMCENEIFWKECQGEEGNINICKMVCFDECEERFPYGTK